MPDPDRFRRVDPNSDEWKKIQAAVGTTDEPAPEPDPDVGDLPAVQESEWDEVVQRVQERKPGFLESLGRGLAEGGMFGFSDEASAGLQDALHRLSGDKDVPRTTERGLSAPVDERSRYERIRDEERAGLEQAREAHPIVTGLGEGAGLVSTAAVPGGSVAKLANLARARGLAVPAMKAGGRFAAEAAGVGALEGLGRSESDSAAGAALDTAVGAGAGLVGGAAARGLGQGAQALGRTAPAQALQAAARRVGRGVQESSAIQRLQAMGIQGKKAGEGVMRFSGGPQQLAAEAKRLRISGHDDARRVMSEAGDRIGDFIDDQAGKARVSSDRIVQGIQELAGEVQGPSSRRILSELNRHLKYYQGKPRISLQDLHQERIGLDDVTRHDSMRLPHRYRRRLRGIVNSAMDEAIDQSGADRAAWKAMNRDYEVAKTISDVAESPGVSEFREGLTDRAATNLAMGIGALGGGGGWDSEQSRGFSPVGAAVGALGGLAAKKAAVPIARGIRRGVTQLLGDTLTSAPQRLGRYATQLQQAASRSPAAFAATHYTLSQQDPAYRELTKRLAEEDDEENDE